MIRYDPQWSDWYERLCEELLDLLSEEEQESFYYYVKGSLPEISSQVHAMMDQIREYLGFALNPPPGIAESVPIDQLLDWEYVPELPVQAMPEKGLFLLGCYWVLSEARILALDLHRLLLEAPGERTFDWALPQLVASRLFSMPRHSPLWPWNGHPFYV